MIVMRPRHGGFTLLELLLVVFILAALAATTSSLVDRAHEQARFEDTSARLGLLRRAIVGAEDPSVAIAGYVADVGALPGSVSDLLAQPAGVPPYGPNDPTHPELRFGWRGPYLRGTRRPGGAVEFADGWGSPDRRDYAVEGSVDPNFGWDWLLSPGPPPTLTITSRGENQIFDDPGNPIDDQVEVIQDNDYLVDLAGRRLEARVHVLSSGAVPPADLALRVLWPRGESTLADVDAPALPDDDVAPNETKVLTFAVPSATWVPAGPRLVVLCRRTGPLSPYEPVEPRQVALIELRPRAAPASITISRRFDLP
ncbi:MAG: prepilin-type N-terminal cleavage/methylation domain-containing protein [Planctomycetes bacterium]|nr:prepilin-type N-terminal cleavage/methylation domain-containing protein [Planctomycetota bacterium]